MGWSCVDQRRLLGATCCGTELLKASLERLTPNPSTNIILVITIIIFFDIVLHEEVFPSLCLFSVIEKKKKKIRFERHHLICPMVSQTWLLSKNHESFLSCWGAVSTFVELTMGSAANFIFNYGCLSVFSLRCRGILHLDQGEITCKKKTPRKHDGFNGDSDMTLLVSLSWVIRITSRSEDHVRFW